MTNKRWWVKSINIVNAACDFFFFCCCFISCVSVACDGGGPQRICWIVRRRNTTIKCSIRFVLINDPMLMTRRHQSRVTGKMLCARQRAKNLSKSHKNLIANYTNLLRYSLSQRPINKCPVTFCYWHCSSPHNITHYAIDGVTVVAWLELSTVLAHWPAIYDGNNFK